MRDQTLERLQKALCWTNSNRIELIVFCDNKIRVRVVSDGFIKIRPETRERLTFSSLAVKDKSLLDEFKIELECLTVQEYKLAVKIVQNK